MTSISSREISVIVQGPIDWSISPRYSRPTTVVLTRALRRLFPDSQIIVSTWEGQAVDGLSFDSALFNEDPGPQGVWPSFTPNNVNRQIVSTSAALKRVKTKYALKIRTDIVLLNDSFVREYEVLPDISGDRRIFDRPILSNNLTSRDTRAILRRLADNPILFHPSDHVHFGLTGDLMKLWDIPLQKAEDAFHFMDRTQPNRWRAHELSRLAPEQFVLTQALGKKMPRALRHFADMDDDLLEASDYYLNSHFHFVKDEQFIYFAKYHTDHHRSFEWMRLNHSNIQTSQKKKESIVDRIRKYTRLP